jgi:hypothetical protein
MQSGLWEHHGIRFGVMYPTLTRPAGAVHPGASHFRRLLTAFV